MTSILGRIFGPWRRRDPAPSTEERQQQVSLYHKAIRESDELLDKMRAAYASHDPVRQAMADIWSQRHNIPYTQNVAAKQK